MNDRYEAEYSGAVRDRDTGLRVWYHDMAEAMEAAKRLNEREEERRKLQ